MKITVFTPTYNRAYNLKNVYDSICQQNYENVEWVVVDDGSSDETQQLIKSFSEENKIAIKYFYQQNRGKHFAINKGVSLAKGELFVILDSDDKLPVDALNLIAENYEKVEKRNDIGGICGRKAYFDGNAVGKSNGINKIVTDSLEIRYKHRVEGDLAEVFKTDVLKEVPFPEILNEKFCPEVLVWNRIAQKYKLFFFDDIIYNCEYLPDGLTSKIVKIRMTSPVASMLTYSELESYKIPLMQKIKADINFWRFSFNSSYSFNKKLTMVSLLFSLIGFPIGYAMHIRDKKNNL